jgi:hypothetical protein
LRECMSDDDSERKNASQVEGRAPNVPECSMGQAH